jgi:hypothetical protein
VLARPAAFSSLLTITLAITLACAAEPESPSDSGAADQGEFSCDAIVGEGYELGQVSMNWTLDDADGAPHELYEFCGRPIYIEDTAAW